MSCGAVGDTPAVNETCTAYCDVIPGPDACAFDRCACSETGLFCGSNLPSNCSYDPNAIYICAKDRVIPQSNQTCPSPQVCLEAVASPICTFPECICTDDNTHCGSTFASVCNLQTNSLYQCSTGALPNVTADCSPGVCSANVIPGTSVFKETAGARDIWQLAFTPVSSSSLTAISQTCGLGGCSRNVTFKAAADDICIAQCACKEAGVLVSASEPFPVNTLMTIS